MTVSRLRKWLLFFVACCLGFLAVTLLLIRLAMSQAEWLTPHLESLLENRIGAPVDIQRLSLSLAGNDPSLTLAGVTASTPEGEPLFRLNELQLRLDSWQTLSTRSPVFSDAFMEGFAVHLYQGDGMAWQWPSPAKLPLAIEAEPDVDLALVDAWVGMVLRQRIQVKNSRIILHGNSKQLALHAPMLTLSGDERRTRLQGRVNIDSPEQSGEPEALPAAHLRAEVQLPAAHLRAEVQPGRQGLRDFSAAMQLDMQLDQLSVLMELLQSDVAPQFTEVGGSAQLWGRWQSARLQEARLAVDMPMLTLEQSEQRAILRNIKARGIWQREGEGGKAWLSGDAENVEWARPDDVGEGPALPRHWQFSHPCLATGSFLISQNAGSY